MAEGVYELTAPRGRAAPVVVEVPHAGLALPEEARALLTTDMATVRRDADGWVDGLFRDAPSRGATLLTARLSRYVVDLNRGESDVDGWTVRGLRGDAEHPRGVVWRETGDGRPALRRPLGPEEFEARLARYYRPYHRCLEGCLTGLRARHPHVLLVCAHSMPSTGVTAQGDVVRRADVVPGTRGRSTAARALVDAVEQHFRAAGLRVRHDEPYRGGATTARWGRPDEGLHAVQVEINRALYMDERTGDPEPEGFAWVASLCASLVERLVECVETLR